MNEAEFPATTAVDVDPLALGPREKLTPDPFSATDWGLPTALLAIEIEPVRAPEVVGEKVSEIEQLAVAASVEPQLLV